MARGDFTRIASALVLPVFLAACAGGEMPSLPLLSPGVAAPVASGALVRARGLLDDGYYDEASVLFSRLLEADPKNPEIRLGMAETMLGQGRHKDALAQLDALASAPQTKARAELARGIALIALKEPARACASFRVAVDTDATLWRAWNGIAHCHDLGEEFAAADAAYGKALALKPGSAMLHNNRGFSYLLRNDYKNAEENFSLALKIDPQSAVSRTNLRLALAAQGRYDEALAGVDDSQMSAVLNDLGFIATLRGDYAAGERYLNQAMAKSPSFNVAAWRNLNQLGRLKAAAAKR